MATQESMEVETKSCQTTSSMATEEPMEVAGGDHELPDSVKYEVDLRGGITGFCSVLFRSSMATEEPMEVASGDHELPDSVKYEVDFFTSVNKNELDAVQIMLQSGRIDVNKFNIMRKAPIYFAIQNENIPMVKLLIEHNADLGLESYCNVYCNYETPIVTAARVQNMELVELLLEHNCTIEGDSNAGKQHDYKSALQWAAGFGNMAMAELLYERGAQVNWTGPHFYTALHYATMADQVEMVTWLMERGAKVTINGDARTPLHTSAVRGNFAIVKYLMEHSCRIDAKDCFSFTPFSLACLRGHLDIVRYMYELQTSKGLADLNDGLRRAAECGYSQVLAFLIENGADVNSKNAAGETAISIAAHGRVGQKDQYNAVELLINKGACINVESRGNTPLTMTLLREQNDIAALLIKHGANLDAIYEGADCPLHIAFNTSNPLLVKFLIQAGCHFCTQQWFTLEAAAEKIQEMDFHTPGPARFRRDSDIQKATWEWIKTRMGQPRSLAQLARRELRAHIVRRVTGGASVLPVIQALPLPTSVKKYLALEDVLSE